MSGRRPAVWSAARVGVVGCMLAAAGAAGCVERVVKITTQPPGALVMVNDEEVGVSPAKFNFVWYGDYDLIVRKPGYETLKTHFRIDPPWYEYPPLDFLAEVLWPGQIRDVHELPAFELAAAETPEFGEVIERAVELRERALFQSEPQRAGRPAAGATTAPATQPAESRSEAE